MRDTVQYRAGRSTPVGETDLKLITWETTTYATLQEVVDIHNSRATPLEIQYGCYLLTAMACAVALGLNIDDVRNKAHRNVQNLGDTTIYKFEDKLYAKFHDFEKFFEYSSGNVSDVHDSLPHELVPILKYTDDVFYSLNDQVKRFIIALKHKKASMIGDWLLSLYNMVPWISYSVQRLHDISRLNDIMTSAVTGSDYLSDAGSMRVVAIIVTTPGHVYGIVRTGDGLLTEVNNTNLDDHGKVFLVPITKIEVLRSHMTEGMTKGACDVVFGAIDTILPPPSTRRTSREEEEGVPARGTPSRP